MERSMLTTRSAREISVSDGQCFFFFVGVSTSLFKEDKISRISRKFLKGLVGKARSNSFYGSPFPVQIHPTIHLEWACSIGKWDICQRFLWGNFWDGHSCCIIFSLFINVFMHHTFPGRVSQQYLIGMECTVVILLFMHALGWNLLLRKCFESSTKFGDICKTPVLIFLEQQFRSPNWHHCFVYCSHVQSLGVVYLISNTAALIIQRHGQWRASGFSEHGLESRFPDISPGNMAGIFRSQWSDNDQSEASMNKEPARNQYCTIKIACSTVD